MRARDASAPLVRALARGLVIAASLTGGAQAGFAQDFLLPGTPVVVRTDHGPVSGRLDQGVVSFRGIPYAAPPLGRLRFHPPVDAKPWHKTLDAWRRAPACPQALNTTDPTENGDGVMSEDCLTLNVWTPAAGSGQRPVMVFIHGGGLLEGSAADDIYDGAAIARAGDVVVVTIQYRLGVLGYLTVGEKGGPEFESSGNDGLLDQIAALRWVRDNARLFGGDPGNVTVFGESAGGASIFALLASPLARGLLHKAIIESGTSSEVQPRARALGISERVFKEAGARSLAELQAVSVERLLKIQESIVETADMSAFTFELDDRVLPRAPIEAVANDAQAGVPLLIGTNLEEMRYCSAMDGIAIDEQPPEALNRRLEALFGQAGGKLLDEYRKHQRSTQEAITTLIGDAIFRIPSLRLAEANAVHAPTFVYLFTYRSPARGPTGLEYGALHGMEVIPVFQVDLPVALTYAGPKRDWWRLSEQMVAAWTTFARTGNPDNPQLPHWPRYEPSLRATMGLGTHSDVLMDPLGFERAAWDSIPSSMLEDARVIQLWDLPVAVGPQ